MQILQFVIDGLLLGGVYAAVGVGFALVWGIMNIINLAHGAMIMLGAYVTFWLFKLAGVDPFASIPVAMAMLFILGWLIQRYLINYVVRAPMLITFLMTFGLELLIVDLSLNFFSADNRSVQTFYSGARLDLGGLAIPLVHLYTLMVALVLVTLLQLFLVRTRIGNAIQATSMDLDAARLVGINISRVYALTFAISAAAAGAAGSLIGVNYSINPTAGAFYTPIAFVVCVLGGLGSISGALVGGLMFGVVQSMSQAYIGPAYQNAIAFALLILVLLVRPTGILGVKTAT
ncbi:MAG TPA: branched-chain amino acid ABC transporter permease [Chloroflexota bacterium]|nr:branched-chain amino acid ABC transporter permease [Chloroflexota bacterium]